MIRVIQKWCPLSPHVLKSPNVIHNNILNTGVKISWTPFLSLNLEIIIGWPLSPQGSFWAQFIYKIFFFILSSRLYFCSISSHVLAFFTFMFSAYNFEMRAVLGDSIMKKWVFVWNEKKVKEKLINKNGCKYHFSELHHFDHFLALFVIFVLSSFFEMFLYMQSSAIHYRDQFTGP